MDNQGKIIIRKWLKLVSTKVKENGKNLNLWTNWQITSCQNINAQRSVISVMH